MRINHQHSGRVGFVHDAEDRDQQLELEIDYVIYPGEPMVRYTRNGDGYPGSPPECEIHKVRCTSINLADGERVPDEAENVEIAAWFENQMNADDKLRDRVEEACSEDAARRLEDAQEAEAEAAYERRRGL